MATPPINRVPDVSTADRHRRAHDAIANLLPQLVENGILDLGPGGWTMEKEMLDYVIPYVEKEFRVIKDKDHRATGRN